MKKTIESIIICVLCITIILLMSGCNGDNNISNYNLSEKNDVALVLGIHRNFGSISLNGESIYDSVVASSYTYGNVYAVAVDGDPHLFNSYSVNRPTANVDNIKKKQLAKQNTVEIMNQIASIRASAPEVDTFKAIKVGADSLKSGSGTVKNLIIIDSGLSTAGLLNFASNPNLINMSPEQIVEQLKGKYALPDLTNIDVTMIGCGQVTGAQTTLPSSYEHKLREIWDAVLKASGARSVNIRTDQISSKEPECDLPYVTTVETIADALDVSAIDLPDVIRIGEETVKFNGDQSTFIDASAAEKAIKPIAQYLNEHKETKIFVVGMTATAGDATDRINLSLARANACKEVLIKHGVSDKQINIIGLGYRPNSLRVNDTDASGHLIEEQAKINRAVYFMREDSPLLEELIN